MTGTLVMDTMVLRLFPETMKVQPSLSTGRTLKFKPVGLMLNLSLVHCLLPILTQAANFNLGIPNVVAVYNPGSNYYFGNVLIPEASFPSVYIPGYNGTPVPVIDRQTGEFVAVPTNANSWDAEHPQPTATAIP